MRGHPALLLAFALAATACSSSSSSPITTTKDAGTKHPTHDAAKEDGAARDGGAKDATEADASLHDSGAHKPDAHGMTKKDTGVVSPFDAFVYPEAAIPHDAGRDAPVSPCEKLPDESSYCAPADGGGSSTGFYTCMQGNGIYSPCAPGTVCTATDSGALGIACEK